MSDSYIDAYVILDDEDTYGSAEGAKVVVFDVNTTIINVDALEHPATDLPSFGSETVSLPRLIEVYKAAQALARAPWDPEDGSISDEVVDAVHGVIGAYNDVG